VLGFVAPTNNHGAGDDQVFKNPRKVGASPIGVDQSDFFLQAAIPYKLAGISLEATKVPRDTLGVYPACFRITYHRRPTHTGVGHFCKVNIEPVLPNLLARRSVNAYHFLALYLSARLISDEGIELAVHNDGSRPAAKFFAFPDKVAILAPLGVPGI